MTKIKMDNMTKQATIKKGGKSSLIHESFFDDAKIETLPIEVRYMIVGLIVKADLWGCYDASASIIRRNIFYADPKYTDKMIDEWIKLLQDLKIIHVYEGEDNGFNKYLIFTKWQRYQNYRYIPYPEYPLPPNWHWTRRWADKYEEIYGENVAVPDRLQKQYKKAESEEKKRLSYTKEEKTKIQYVVDGFFAAFKLQRPGSDKYRMYVRGTKEILEKFNQDEKVALDKLIMVAQEQRDRGGYYWKDKWTNISALANSFDSILGSLERTKPVTTHSGGGTPASKVPDIV